MQTVRPRHLLSTAVLATVAASLLGAAPASAERVNGPGPWKATNTYRATADLDGRSQPRLKPVARVNHVRAGQWIRIQCQAIGQEAYGSKVWIKTGGLFVPDKYVKTYTDSFLAGVPTCGSNDPAPSTPPPPSGPTRTQLAFAVGAVAFEDVYGSNYRIYKARYPQGALPNTIIWDNNGCSVPKQLIGDGTVHLPRGLKVTNPLSYYSGLFEKSCDRHDFGYRNYGGKTNGLRLDGSVTKRAQIDSKLHKNMDIQCRHYFGRKVAEYVQRRTCYKVADVFYSAVRIGGGKNFYG